MSEAKVGSAATKIQEAVAKANALYATTFAKTGSVACEIAEALKVIGAGQLPKHTQWGEYHDARGEKLKFSYSEGRTYYRIATDPFIREHKDQLPGQVERLRAIAAIKDDETKQKVLAAGVSITLPQIQKLKGLSGRHPVYEVVFPFRFAAEDVVTDATTGMQHVRTIEGSSDLLEKAMNRIMNDVEKKTDKLFENSPYRVQAMKPRPIGLKDPKRPKHESKALESKEESRPRMRKQKREQQRKEPSQVISRARQVARGGN